MDLVMNDPGDRLFYRGKMRGLQLRLYSPGDEARVEARADFARSLAEAGFRLPAGPKWTLVDGDTVLAVGGIDVIGFQLGGAWAYSAQLTPRQWAFAAMVVRPVIRWAKRRLRVREVQAIPAHTSQARRLLRHMGFRRGRVTWRGEIYFFKEAA